MFGDIIIVHRPGGAGHATLAKDLQANSLLGSDYGSVFVWQTCLRQIALVDGTYFSSDSVLETDIVYRGEAAYRFLLEVICGLHSSVLGETEVYGQFKNAVASFILPNSPFGGQLKRLFRVLFEDAKQIRETHLKDLGSQSYGSVVRREVRGLKKIHVIGAGHLVQEILPWIRKDGTEVHIHARDVARAKKTIGTMKDVVFHQLDERADLQDMQALVIAAPVTSDWTKNWLAQDARALECIIDLRADSATDRVVMSSAQSGGTDSEISALDLDQVFRKISNNLTLLDTRKAKALEAVANAAEERSSYVEYRPFGWEDVCA